MQIEGVTLVLAHEVGHHRAVADFPGETGENGLACEGVSDYWATRTGLRLLYNANGADSNKYKDTVRLGVEQSYAVLTGGLAVDPGSFAGQKLASFDQRYCGHPVANCRREIYIAGFAKTPIPACHNQQPSGFMADGQQVENIKTLDEIIKGGEDYLRALEERNKSTRTPN
jgi:hypothetical protein